MARHQSLRLKKALGLLLPIALLIFLTGGPTADAQFSNSSSWLDQWFAPQQQQQAPRPRRVYRPVYAPRHRAVQQRLERPGQVAAPEKPAVAPSYFVMVLGDSLGTLLGQGLTEAFADRPGVAIKIKGSDNSGLVRDDYFNWPKTVHDLLASDTKINIAVIMVGINDSSKSLRIDNVNYEPGSPKWVEAYSARIAEISQAFREKHIPLIWVGLPIAKDNKLTADFLTFNDLYRTQAEKAGATYIDIWEAFENDSGQYDPFGPDVNGQTVRIRTADGVNFTKAGARKLAHFVEANIRRNLDASEPQVDPAVVTVPADTPAAAVQGPAAPAPAVVAAPVAPVKPVAGPVLPLTGPISTPGAQLATRLKVKANETDRAVLGHALADEKPSSPKPDRADNFVWPKP